MTEHQDKVLTIEELAAYLKVSKSTMYKLAQNGEVPGQKVGKHWRGTLSTSGWRTANLQPRGNKTNAGQGTEVSR